MNKEFTRRDKLILTTGICLIVLGIFIISTAGAWAYEIDDNVVVVTEPLKTVRPLSVTSFGSYQVFTPVPEAVQPQAVVATHRTVAGPDQSGGTNVGVVSGQVMLVLSVFAVVSAGMLCVSSLLERGNRRR
jgi:hypothetical protein